jgi:hypothetical protein
LPERTEPLLVRLPPGLKRALLREAVRRRLNGQSRRASMGEVVRDAIEEVLKRGNGGSEARIR